jgi:hypothetical protein
MTATMALLPWATQLTCALRSALCALRSALCALRSALCALRSALCALRSALNAISRYRRANRIPSKMAATSKPTCRAGSVVTEVSPGSSVSSC